MFIQNRNAGSPASMPIRVLIARNRLFDEFSALRSRLAERECEVLDSATAREAIELVEAKEFDLIFLDWKTLDADGAALLETAREKNPGFIAVLTAGRGEGAEAIEALSVGGFEAIVCPLDPKTSLWTIDFVLGASRQAARMAEHEKKLTSYKLGLEVVYSRDLNMVLSKIANGAVQASRADEVSIMLPTRSGRELYVAAVCGEPRSHLIGYHMGIDKGVAGWVARNKQMLKLQGQINDSRFAAVRPRTDIRASVLIPLLYGEDLMGVLNANVIHRKAFLPAEIEALDILADFAAVALSNARSSEAVNSEQ